MPEVRRLPDVGLQRPELGLCGCGTYRKLGGMLAHCDPVLQKFQFLPFRAKPSL